MLGRLRGRVTATVASASLAAIAALGGLAPTPAVAHDSPAGFWYGTDSWPMPVGGGGPFTEPRIGGAYGGYIGMVGGWASWLGWRGSFVAWSSTNSAQANANLSRYGRGIGTGVYWFMGGPGVDPNYDGSAREAYAWGARQAAQALADSAGRQLPYRVLFIDVEEPLIAPAPDNGWNVVYNGACSGQVRTRYIPPRIDRADLNGFYDTVKRRSSFTPGVYSSPAIWRSIFGTGPASAIPHTDEWTYEPETRDLGQAPSGWCLRGTSSCAQFFGGVNAARPQAVMWQWSGGGGVSNGIGDFDQIHTR